jgi:lipid-A-disaccharide synthase-like uncharacterized protein
MSETTFFEVLGFVGIAIGVSAYVPQVAHLAREHCSAGVSGGAWAMWLTSSMLIGALALHRHDPVFIALQASSLSSTAAILILAHRYRGMVCESHAHRAPRGFTKSSVPGDEMVSPPELRGRRPRLSLLGDVMARGWPSERMGVHDE